MLIDEARLRELYAAGEIDIDQLERSLDIINRRRTAAEHRVPSSAAAAPMPLEARAERVDKLMALQSATPRRRRPPGPPCPMCGTETRAVVEYGVQTAWCPTCQAYAGADPRQLAVEHETCDHGTTIVGGVIFPLDGGLFG